MITIFFSAIAVIIGVMFLNNRTGRKVSGSWIKSLIYLVAIVIVGVFFYKTNQVVTIQSSINIEGYRASCSKGQPQHVLDSIGVISIYNNFSSDSFNDAIRDKENDKSTDVSLTIKAPKNVAYEFKDIVSHGSIVGMCNNLNVSPNDLGRMYQVIFSSASLPKFLPIHIQEEKVKPVEGKRAYIQRSNYFRNYYEPEGIYSLGPNEDDVSFNDYFTPNGLQKFHSKYATLLACDNLHANADLEYNGYIEGSVFDFFTAADISQYILGLSVFSDCPIDAIEVRYDIPIEVSSDNRGITSGTFAFFLHSGLLKDTMNSGVSHILVKLPTMANLQLVRSFILTTLLTALFTLFFASLSDLLLRWKMIIAYFYHKFFNNSHSGESTKLELWETKEERLFKVFRLIIVLLCSSFILYVCYRVYIDEPKIMSQEEFDRLCSILINTTIVLSGALLFIYIRMYKAKRRLQNNK